MPTFFRSAARTFFLVFCCRDFDPSAGLLQRFLLCLAAKQSRQESKPARVAILACQISSAIKIIVISSYASCPNPNKIRKVLLFSRLMNPHRTLRRMSRLPKQNLVWHPRERCISRISEKRWIAHFRKVVDLSTTGVRRRIERRFEAEILGHPTRIQPTRGGNATECCQPQELPQKPYARRQTSANLEYTPISSLRRNDS